MKDSSASETCRFTPPKNDTPERKKYQAELTKL
jgi:hypothetical protein